MFRTIKDLVPPFPARVCWGGALLCILFLWCSCSTQQKTTATQHPNRMIVLYFSATGTTARVAQLIGVATGAPVAEIAPTVAYTAADLDWRNSKSRSSVEMADSTCRPAIKPIDLHDANVIYLGYPIWWDLAPRQVYTFLENIDLEGKTIIPFATSGSSTISNSVRVLQQTYPKAVWKEGKLLNGATAATVNAWVK
ncbi:MAG: flavodoxin [Bacteroidaceae bacterium]|nr:flavodoxin [Bacteroidaceae bacterium]